MPTRPILCPHCHSPLDPAELDAAQGPEGCWRLCPVCDEVLLFQPRAVPGSVPTDPPPLSPVSVEV